MREIHIDLSSDYYLQQPKVFGGYAGEHNESKLLVKLPDRMVRDDIDYYYFEFQTVLEEHITSPNVYKNNLSNDNEISIILWEQLLPSAGNLKFCINAINIGENGAVTIKGKTSVFTLYILESPTGENVLIDPKSSKEELQKSIDSALKEAKDSGEFKGDKGDKGETGAQGIQGVQGIQGEKGDKGDKGEDGYTPQKGVDYFTDEDIKAINKFAAIIPGEGYSSIKQNHPETMASGDRSASIGVNVQTSGTRSISMGVDLRTRGNDGINLGFASQLYNQDGVSLGRENRNYSHVGITAGYKNIAGLQEYAGKQWGEDIARGAIAVGWENHATHAFSCVLGDHNNSSRDVQTVFGRFCADDPNALFIIGNGEDKDNRSNLYTVDRDGNACFTGGVYVGSSKKNGEGSKRLATEEYADNAVKDKIERKRADNTFSNTLKSSKSGELLLIDDISPVNHEMSVKISSDTVTDLTAVKVTRCGKNLIQTNIIEVTSPVNVEDLIWQGHISGKLSFSLDNSEYTPKPSNVNSANFKFVFGDGTVKYLAASGPHIYLNTSSPLKEIYFLNWGEGTGVLKNIQLEIGSPETDYEPYVEPTEYTPNADGTVSGVTSLYPNTTLMTDTEGVIIDCEYNRDINKAFAELQQAIISLGGNI